MQTGEQMIGNISTGLGESIQQDCTGLMQYSPGSGASRRNQQDDQVLWSPRPKVAGNNDAHTLCSNNGNQETCREELPEDVNSRE